MKENLSRFKKVFKFSLSSIAIISVVAVIYSFINIGDTMKRIFDFNYFFAAIILLYGIGVYFMPVRLNKKKRLVDHSNYMDVLREEKEMKIEGALESIFWGISNMLLVGVIEIILYSIV